MILQLSTDGTYAYSAWFDGSASRQLSGKWILQRDVSGTQLYLSDVILADGTRGPFDAPVFECGSLFSTKYCFLMDSEGAAFRPLN